MWSHLDGLGLRFDWWIASRSKHFGTKARIGVAFGLRHGGQCEVGVRVVLS